MRADSARCPICSTPVEPFVPTSHPDTSHVPPPTPDAGWGPPMAVAPQAPAPALHPSWGRPGENLPPTGVGWSPHGTAVTAVPPPPSRKKRKVLPALVSVVVLVAIAGGAYWYLTRSTSIPELSGRWQRVTTTSGAYSVELPGVAHRDQRSVPVAGIGEVAATALYTGDGGLQKVAPGALVIEAPATFLPAEPASLPPALAQPLLKSGTEAAISTIGGTVTATSEARSDLGTAIGFTAEGGSGEHLRGVVVLAGRTLVGMVVTAPADADDAAQDALDRIVKSLRPV
jgi:hypothetical protein